MKFNERSVAYYATCDSPTDKTGYLHKKGERNTAYHRRWFVLKGNLLFYFEEREGREPVGVIILEGCTVELCVSSEEYAFAIKFESAKSRTYKMSAESQREMESWVKALSRASFDYMRIVVKALEKQLEEMQQKRLNALLHEPSARYGSTTKENGYAFWSTTQELNGTAVDHAPDIPIHTQRSGNSSFSRMHEWFGFEVLQLRRQWNENKLQNDAASHQPQTRIQLVLYTRLHFNLFLSLRWNMRRRLDGHCT
uniref:Sesquipedalian n=1 Tax=Callorhinchus milii TaxID=7868 RepID=A0A4W3HZL3_CALMI